MRAIYLLIAAQSVATFGTRATTFNAAADFSIASNQNGPWSYGWYDGAFHLSTTVSSYSPDTYFMQGNLKGPLGEPTIGKNEGASLLSINNSTTLAPGVLAMHPGRNDQKAALRWTAPAAGVYTIAARFKGLDWQTSTDVAIRDGDEILTSGEVNGRKDSFDYFGQFTLEENDIFDFIVGLGSNNSFYYDTTRVDVIITDQSLAAPLSFDNPNTTGLPVFHLDWINDKGPEPLFTRAFQVPDQSNPLLLFLVSLTGLAAFSRSVAHRRS